MRLNVTAWVLLVGACTSPDATQLGGVSQEVADPAPTLSITSTSFSNVVGGTGLTAVNYCGQSGWPACTAAPVVQVRWGTPAFTVEQSGLGFDAAASHVIVYEASFAIGSLTHFNFPTYAGTWASNVDLDLHLRITPSVAGPDLFNQPIKIPLQVLETPNAEPASACPYPSTTPCSDKITFGTSTFQLGAASATTVYELEILGFVNAATSTTVDGLMSEEYATSSAVLMGVLRESCIDADNDDVCDEDDNCVGTANPLAEGATDQDDADGDGLGDACDACPTDATNDADGDGVCGPPDPCPCDADWNNHGEYVSCVAHETNRLVGEGKMTHGERAQLVSTAGQSSCGQ